MARRAGGVVVASGALVAALAAGTTVAAQQAEAPVSATVALKQFRFTPPSVTVREGGTVTWTYAETATDVPLGCESPVFQAPGPLTCPGHSTTATGRGADGRPLWDSGVRRAGGYPYRVRFDRAGTYRYVCTVHTGGPLGPMTGEVVVLAGSAPTPAPGSGASPAGAGTSPVPRLPARSTPITVGRTPPPPLPLADTGRTPFSVATVLAAAAAGFAIRRLGRRREGGAGNPVR